MNTWIGETNSLEFRVLLTVLLQQGEASACIYLWGLCSEREGVTVV